MYRHYKPAIFLIAVLFALRCVPAQDSAATLSIRGDVQKPVQWSVEELKSKLAGQIQDVTFVAGKDKQTQVGTGVPLFSLIQAAAPKTDKGIKHHDLAFLVILEAGDAYRVFFSLAELMPRNGPAQAFLIWNVDGKPLSGKEAPLRLVCSTNQPADRLIYGVNSITLVDGIKLANQYK
jgi:DMSO/TMAO reductase YedYZ molybdopterin-dependent catalytic subunit